MQCAAQAGGHVSSLSETGSRGREDQMHIWMDKLWVELEFSKIISA